MSEDLVQSDAGVRRLSSRWIAMLAVALAVSWSSMLFHNQWELPITPLDVENTGPLIAAVILLAACWRWQSSRLAWSAALAWGVLNAIGGGVLTVLPLPILPFVPEQTVDHYLVHVVYVLGQVPLLVVSILALRRLRRGRRSR